MGNEGQILINNKGNKNYIFYVTELENTPLKGHFRKMDAEIEIVNQIKRSIAGSRIMKYTEYGGEVIDADSVGIVFPAHTWGISVAVLTFLSHLKIRRGAYIYAVAVGESISGDVDCSTYDTVKLLGQFEKVFGKKSIGCESDIFVRCTDRKRKHGSTEENLRGETDRVTNIKHVLSGLLFHTVDSINTMEKLDEDERYYEGTKDSKDIKSNIIPIQAYQSARTNKIILSNIFLDEDIFRGVKLCQVM